jgi:flagellar basal body-associated protein FliL
MSRKSVIILSVLCIVIAAIGATKLYRQWDSSNKARMISEIPLGTSMSQVTTRLRTYTVEFSKDGRTQTIYAAVDWPSWNIFLRPRTEFRLSFRKTVT